MKKPENHHKKHKEKDHKEKNRQPRTNNPEELMKDQEKVILKPQYSSPSEPLDLTMKITTPEPQERRHETERKQHKQHHKQQENRNEHPPDHQLKRKSTSGTKSVKRKKSKSSPHANKQVQETSPDTSKQVQVEESSPLTSKQVLQQQPKPEVKSFLIATSPSTKSKKKQTTLNRKLMGERRKKQPGVNEPLHYLKLNKFHRDLYVTMDEDFKMVLYSHIHCLSSDENKWKQFVISDKNEETNIDVMKCDKCAFETTKQCNIRRHINTAHLHHGDKKCTYAGCNFTAKTKETVVKHYIQEHSAQIIAMKERS